MMINLGQSEKIKTDFFIFKKLITIFYAGPS